MLFHTFRPCSRQASHLLKHLLVILALALATAACDGAVGPQGDRGAQGPEGPAGADGQDGERGPVGADGEDGARGPRGPAGPQGPAGEDGEDGNANVIYSDWFFPDWNDIDLARFKRMIVNDPEFGGAYDDGVILFYWVTNNGSTFLLPWNSHNSAGALVISRYVNVRGASGDVWLTIRKFGSDFTPTETEGQVGGITHNRIRYVIIPGGVPTGGLQAGLHADLDLRDYEAVKAYYGIPDEGAGHIPLSH